MPRLLWGCGLLILLGCGTDTSTPDGSNTQPAELGRALMQGNAAAAAQDLSVETCPGPERDSPRATEPSADESPYQTVRLNGIPHVRQKPDFCGEACAEMFLRRLGHKGDQDYVFDQAQLSPLEGRGCYTKELNTALTRIGFRTGTVWHRIAAQTAADGLNAQWKALHADLLRGAPSIVCMHYDDAPQTTEHFRLIVGYDRQTDEVLYHEPAERDGAYRRMGRATFLELWPLKYDPQQWTVIRLALEPRRLAKGSAARTLTAADHAQHIMRLKKKLPNDDFHMVLQPPFVIVGDESPAMVRRRASGTIQWAVDRLKAAYFAHDPDHLIDIWLFKDKASYDKHVEEIFGEKPTTPFGFYSPRHRALIMNIATGGGTLVHEIVHPFVAANFPNCPSWLNEGLGSLYEQCGDQNGRIHGYTNWRLAGLQRAIRAESVPTFQELCETSDSGFYTEDPGTNYSQARYLCYYLQQRGLLRKFYHQFHKSVDDDPTGYETLQTVLGSPDMEKFQQVWSDWILTLKYP